jgi:hypothetical protein
VPHATTNKPAYNRGETVVFLIRNDKGAAIHFMTCCSVVPYHVDRFEGGNWTAYSNFGLPCVYRCPRIFLTVDSSHPRVDSLFSTLESGMYRLRIPFLINEDGAARGEIMSNVFVVH